MVTIRLDRDGNSPMPNGFTLVSSEVEFLKWAISDQPLHIRGDRLCTWAQAFYTGQANFGPRNSFIHQGTSYPSPYSGTDANIFLA